MAKNNLFVKLVPNRDVCDVESEALITAVDSNGIWCGNVDMAIREKVGNHYHQSLFGYIRQKTGTSIFSDGEAILVKGLDTNIKAKFNDIIFVIDDCHEPLSEIVFWGLMKANAVGYKEITMSAIRAGESFGRVEKTYESMSQEVEKAIKRFLKEKNIILEKLSILTYDKNVYETLLFEKFKKEDLITVIL